MTPDEKSYSVTLYPLKKGLDSLEAKKERIAQGCRFVCCLRMSALILKGSKESSPEPACSGAVRRVPWNGGIVAYAERRRTHE